MIKQFTVENIYNFKNEVTLDFTLSKNDGLYHVYHKDKISNTSVMYGKNNVGKSNLFKGLEQAIDMILNNNLKLQPYYPDGSNENSVFEIILENEDYEIRYGFEILINQKIVKDEWMYSKVNGSTRESLIFGRADSKYSKYFNKNQLATFDNLVANKLIVNHCRSLKEQPDVIKSFLKMLHSFTFMSCINKDDTDLLPSIFSYHETPQIKQIMTAFLETSDLDIVSIDTQQLSESENFLFEALKQITNSDLPEEKKREMNKKLTSENLDLFANLLSKNLIVRQDGSNKEDTVFIQFTHKNG
ncbi:MAG: AAA family ATPase, partial [Erysipelothrix sp.]